MEQEQMETNLKGIRQLLSHLHGEITALEASYTQMLRVLRKLEGEADFDELTGLLRKKAFFSRWTEVLEECAKLGKNCGVLMVDIDHFKNVNDTHGHPTGDAVIQRVGELLKQFESPRVFAGRYGGEEFVVSVQGTDAEILGIAEMMRRSIERLHGPVVNGNATKPSNVEWRCTASVGMASAAKDGHQPEKLLQAADDALYEAKTKGRNQVRVA